MKIDIKEMVKDNKKVRFVHFKIDELWYETETGFRFPVPTNREEIGEAVFLAEDKAILFMRYIKRQIKLLEEASEESGYSPPIDFPKVK